MKCQGKNPNSLESATRDYKQYEKLGLFVVENVISPEEENEIFQNFKKQKWENLSH